MRRLFRILCLLFFGVTSLAFTRASFAAPDWHRLNPPAPTAWSGSYSMDAVLPAMQSGKNGAQYQVRVMRVPGGGAKDKGNVRLNTAIGAELTAICEENHRASLSFEKISLSPYLGNYKVPNAELTPAKEVLDSLARDEWLQRALCDDFEKYLKRIETPKPSADAAEQQRKLLVRAARALECRMPDASAISSVVSPAPDFPNFDPAKSPKFSKSYKVTKDVRPYGFRARSYALGAVASKPRVTFYSGVFVLGSASDVLQAVRKNPVIEGAETFEADPRSVWLSGQPTAAKRWTFVMRKSALKFMPKEAKNVAGRIVVDETPENGVVFISCEYSASEA